jgi:hypothetical protein
MSFKTITVNPKPWAETPIAWGLLTRVTPCGNFWSKCVWFPKEYCLLSKKTGLLTLPLWLYNKKINADELSKT